MNITFDVSCDRIHLNIYDADKMDKDMLKYLLNSTMKIAYEQFEVPQEDVKIRCPNTEKDEDSKESPIFNLDINYL